MAKSFDFTLDRRANSGLNTLMKSATMQTILNSAAQQAADAAGDGYAADPARRIRFIAIARVRAATWKARRDNNKNETLEKAVGGVRI